MKTLCLSLLSVAGLVLCTGCEHPARRGPVTTTTTVEETTVTRPVEATTTTVEETRPVRY